MSGWRFPSSRWSWPRYYWVRTMLFGVDTPGFPSLVVSIAFFSGVQLLSLGVLGEYIARIFNEVKGRPLYLVAERLGGRRNRKQFAPTKEILRWLHIVWPLVITRQGAHCRSRRFSRSSLPSGSESGSSPRRPFRRCSRGCPSRRARRTSRLFQERLSARFHAGSKEVDDLVDELRDDGFTSGRRQERGDVQPAGRRLRTTAAAARIFTGRGAKATNSRRSAAASITCTVRSIEISAGLNEILLGRLR